ncbi:excinuclease ABC subunit UvrA [[Mycoplasma] falconis]|uniref:UvrABC system protein A n=1 Tax=[Mycoplasma] falconis TaxID=92403 RepID=A0A501XB33_9BACT|nr:excinuclease ABC subunit UvrA [[Mycoplasma] falconis]TPE57563.1 excinuclease ABC subunit UvrA [[Mycoplasma] falconis]
MKNEIIIKGAKENNLKNVDLIIPRNKFVVFSGVSGSGKSSLAFNTIYEEGRRRYVDSLSNYARQFLGGVKKPAVDSIEGLSPAISIEQKTVHNNPRSIVGTVTEIYDYLRLLFARIGKPFCPNHKQEITAQKTRDILNNIFKLEEGTKLYVLAPLVQKKKGSHQNLFAKLKRDGFLRVKINDEIVSLDEDIELDKNKFYNIDLVIDRLTWNKEMESRVAEAVDMAIKEAKGLVTIDCPELNKTTTYSIYHSCEHGDFEMPKIEPRLFSFNAPAGMCETCKGLGVLQQADFDLIVPDKTLTINNGAITYFKNMINTPNLEWQEFKKMLDYYQISLDRPIDDLSDEQIEVIKYGSFEEIAFTLVSANGIKYEKVKKVEGLVDKLQRKYHETNSEEWRKYYAKYLSDIKCKTCKGKRLNEFALAVKVANLDIYEMCNKSIDELHEIISNLQLSEIEKEISSLITAELLHRTEFLINVGLQYLTLNRKAETLSGGEAQRIRLATQIGSNLTGVLYVLDEPSIGLHQKDNDRLLASLRKMVDIGNSLIVVEHDEDTIYEADYIVDIGPYAGEKGGKIVAAGTLEDIKKAKDSLTGQYLSGEKQIEIPKIRRAGNGQEIKLFDLKTNNLNISKVSFPLGKFVAITGVSGSGKSSLMHDELVTSINKFGDNKNRSKIQGVGNIDKLVEIDQNPIGRTPRSNPATYTNLFTDIREIYASVEESKIRGYTMSRFSFNVPGGRCDKCEGDGVIKIEMHFLPDVYVTCDHCDGKRYKRETLEIKYHGKDINDVLEMTVDEAYAFFVNKPNLRNKLQHLVDVGLGYIKLGQNATTLSGGEAQRVKLATYLQKRNTGKTLFVLDEPTTGLHPYDIQNLLNVLNRIVDAGNTVIVIEHNLDVIKTADYIIDLGPDGGTGGGRIIATGTPEEIAKKEISYTGQYLNRILRK